MAIGKCKYTVRLTAASTRPVLIVVSADEKEEEDEMLSR
jgi:hypothetical protein